MRHCLLASLAAAFSLTSLAASAATFESERIEAPLSIEKIKEFLEDHPGSRVEDLLAALPEDMLQNVSLVFQSRSLQRATPSNPRQILFGLDGRFLLTVGSVPSDPRYKVLEYAQFNPSTGRYQPGEIRFDGGDQPTIDPNPSNCAGCHGSSWSPVWGGYPGWPGVYTDHGGYIAEQDLDGFAAFLATKATEPHLQALDLNYYLDAQPRPKMGAKNRPYGPLNTMLGINLVMTVSTGTYDQISKHPDFERLKWLVMESDLRCEADDIARIGAVAATLYNAELAANSEFNRKYGSLPALDNQDVDRLGRYRLLGVEPNEAFIRNNIDETKTHGQWWSGVQNVFQATEIQAVNYAAEQDPEFKARLGNTADDLRKFVHYIRLAGKDRIDSIRAGGNEYSWYAWIFGFYAALDVPAGRAEALCKAIVEKAEAIR